MKKKEIVKSNILFNEIIKDGYRKKNKYYVLCSIDSIEEKKKFGLAVGTKVGNAVTRNKIKRQMRNIIDKNKDTFPNYHNYVVICKKEILNLTFNEMELNLLDLLKEKTNEN